MQRVDQCIVELQHRLAARADDKAPRFVWWPWRGDHRCERVGRSVFTAVLTVKPDEIRITEAAHRARAIFLAARPYVAPRKSAKYRRAARIRSFALQRVENLLDRVCHPIRRPSTQVSIARLPSKTHRNHLHAVRTPDTRRSQSPTGATLPVRRGNRYASSRGSTQRAQPRPAIPQAARWRLCQATSVASPPRNADPCQDSTPLAAP